MALTDFMAFLIPIIYVVNVHRHTFKEDANISTQETLKQRTRSSRSINSEDQIDESYTKIGRIKKDD